LVFPIFARGRNTCPQRIEDGSHIGGDAEVMSVTARWDDAITPGRIAITVAAAN